METSEKAGISSSRKEYGIRLFNASGLPAGPEVERPWRSMIILLPVGPVKDRKSLRKKKTDIAETRNKYTD